MSARAAIPDPRYFRKYIIAKGFVFEFVCGACKCVVS